MEVLDVDRSRIVEKIGLKFECMMVVEVFLC